MSVRDIMHMASRYRPLRAIPVLACVLTAAGVLVASCTTAQQPPLRVMSWNIAAGFGDLTRIEDVIRAADADIVALQEVDVHWNQRSGFADQASQLATSLGMEVRFGPIYQVQDPVQERVPGEDGARTRQFGLAIFSRYPIVEFHNHVIPRLSTQTAEPELQSLPGFLEAIVQVGDTRVHVFNTHLDYREDPRVRALQVVAMLDIVERASGPVILMGDLNAQPTATELAPLFRHLDDAWRDAADPGFTYPANAPVRRIDYILLSNEFRPLDVRVVPSHASDHMPVVAELVSASRD